MSYSSPWCRTCPGRKGEQLVCDPCWNELPTDMQDDLIRSKLALWEMEAKCLTYLEQNHKADRA